MEYKHILIICGYFCIGFINFMLKGKSFSNLFSSNDYKKNNKVISKYFSIESK